MTDHEEFFSFTRVWPDQFDALVELVKPHLLKTSRRKPLETELRLALTLSYVHCILPRLPTSLYLKLSFRFQKWNRVARGFLHKWQFPNCLGGLDGKHVMIKAPWSSGTQYYNYKKRFSIVLMATCDASYRFTWIDVGQYGSISDGGVCGYSDLCSALNADQVDLPPPKKLPGSDRTTHFKFVGDAAFPLTKFTLTPYPGNNLDPAKRIFNYRLSRARRCIENAFGLLSSRFQIFHRTLAWHPSDVTSIVNATVCLHNCIMDTEAAYLEEARRYSALSDWQRIPREIRNADVARNSRLAVEERDVLRDYFISPTGNGQAPWQYNLAYRGHNINR
ncbi:protein ALP1-like [Diachasma alloeum]|uniref:protein ALP1-like n=1 Tax=Diachasma alloeum TaxID=454923 RepID=UPI0010FB1CBA|nr:protein ALP1-like [Diachasma alloeum]